MSCGAVRDGFKYGVPSDPDNTHMNAHTIGVRYNFDPAKQTSNRKKHGLDLADAKDEPSTVQTSADLQSDKPLRRADIAAGKLVLRKRGTSGAVLPNKQRVNIFLDGAVIEHFKSKAGERGYQTLINEALKQAIQAESIEGVVRKTIREELRRA